MLRPKYKLFAVGLVVLLLMIMAVSCQTSDETPTPTAPAPGATPSETPTPTPSPSPEPATPTPFEVTDQMGRTVTVKANPTKIISLAPSNTEILFALGLGDRVVGRTDFCNYPPEALEVPSIGGFSDPNLEEVIARDPDLVLATSIHEEIVRQLDNNGIPTIVLFPNTIEDILDSITLVGEAAGAEDAAAVLRADMEARIKAVTDKTAGLTAEEKVRTAFVVWHDPLMMAGGDTLYNELIEKSGGINIVADRESYPTVSLEAVLVADPEVMVAMGMGTGGTESYDFLLEEARLGDTEARKNSRVYLINEDLVGRFGPRIVEGLEQLAVFLHPELFD